MCITESVCWRVYASPISSLTSLCFSQIVRWRVCAWGNQFADEFVLRQICSLTSLCFSESIPWRCCLVYGISLGTSMCITESVRWWVFASAKQFDDESVLQRMSSLISLCFSEAVFDKVVRCRESIWWRVCPSLNQFADKCVLCQSIPWRVLAYAD
jgi:hypothetical protein